MCHDLSVGKRKRNECKKEEEINWQIAWYDGLDVLLLNTQKIHSFCVFVRLKIQAQNTNLKHKMFSLLKPNPIFMFYMHDHFTFIKTKNIRGFCCLNRSTILLYKRNIFEIEFVTWKNVHWHYFEWIQFCVNSKDWFEFFACLVYKNSIQYNM